MRIPQPVNQKAVYHSFATIYEQIMNKEISSTDAEQANNALNGMNRSYALELKRAELEKELKGNSIKTEIRIIETKNFDQIPIETGKENSADL